jgi:signal transduction histidine kinase/CheY-like chemotaxis protein
LGRRLTSFIILITLVLGGITITAEYLGVKSITEQYYVKFGRNLAKTAAALIDGDSVDRYLATRVTDPQYEDTLRLLRLLQKNNNILYLYVVKIHSPEMTYFIYDSDEKAPLPLGHPDPWEEDYAEYGEKMFRGEEVEPIVSDGPYGWIISIYEPVYGSGGAVTGYVGLDFSMDRITGEYRAYLFYLGIAVILVIAVFSALYFIFVRNTVILPLNAITRAAEEFAASSGNGRSGIAALDIRTRDELQSLAEALQFMERKINRAIEELVQAEEAAQAGSRSKSAFLANTSHEIRTPMNAIIGMSELILREPVSPEVCEYALGIKQAGINLISIINDILDFSKIESGKIEILPVRYYFRSVVNDVINIIRIRAMEKSLAFAANIDSALPNDLIGDEVRIRQILLNLLGNAVKYTDQGFVKLFIEAEEAGNSGERGFVLKIEVEDCGVGIKEEDLEKVFGEFIQVDMAANRGVEGTGLGLAITKRLCRIMGGDITVRSVYGRGSVFTARIPQRRGSEEPFAAVENPGEKPVLVYEDREVNAGAIRWSLDNLGVPHTLVATEEALHEALHSRAALGRGGYAFAFIAQALYEGVRPALEASEACPVLLADYGSEPGVRRIRILTLPAHTLAVANVLNHEEESGSHIREERDVLKFTAPSARVLIVDDIAANLKVAQGLLVPYNMIIDTCLSGPASIELLKKNAYDLVFMDHMMPGMDGIEAVRIIRETEGAYFKEVPVIALTANAVSGMKEMFLQRGFNDYLAKPIEMSKLHGILEKWIPGKKRIKAKNPGLKDGGTPVYSGVFDGKQIEGIDLAAGADRYGDAFPEILRSYAASVPDFLGALGGVSRDTLEAYAVTVHGIKGTSYQICAQEAGKEAAVLEEAARAGDWETVEARNGHFIRTLEALLKNLEALLKNPEVFPAATGEKTAAPDPALLDKMLQGCKDYDITAMEEALAGLLAHTYESGGELVSWLRKQVDNVEYEAIRERLEKEGRP